MAFAYLYHQVSGVEQLDEYEFVEPTRIFADAGSLLHELGTVRRVYVSYDDLPAKLVNAFIAAEDNRFYSHFGIDAIGVFRALWEAISGDTRQSGASTITMQVAKNFFLTPEKTLERKIKEVFLALKIEQNFTKEEILELYVNKIFFGNKAYGVGAAAKVYFNKELKDLSYAESAVLAAIPKAPSKINPFADIERNLERRNWILSRMYALAFISPEDYQNAIISDIETFTDTTSLAFNSEYISQYIFQEILNSNITLPGKNYTSEEQIIQDGLQIYTSIDPDWQRQAQKKVAQTLSFAERNFSTAATEIKNIPLPENDQDPSFRGIVQRLKIANLTPIHKFGYIPALVLENTNDSLRLLTYENKQITLEEKSLSWYWNKNSKKLSQDILPYIRGDLVYLEYDAIEERYYLTQMPEIQSAFVAMNPETGAVKALIGGSDFFASRFNRATDAKRQLGSTIKPFLYLRALQNGYTAASLVDDAPYIDSSQKGNLFWHPINSGSDFLGSISLRRALYLSRNIISVRLVKDMGLKAVRNWMLSIGFTEEQLPKDLTMSLGSGVISPLKLATQYARLANGGFSVKPYFVEKIVSADGQLLYEHKHHRRCRECGLEPKDSMMTPAQDFILHSMLQDVVTRGTARKAKALERSDIYGKTGTTSNYRDSWFVGYSPKLVGAAWFGYDQGKSIGRGAFGSSLALPLWISFMQEALANTSVYPIEQPETVVKLRLDPKTFSLIPEISLDDLYVPQSLQKTQGIEEFFEQGTEPTEIFQEEIPVNVEGVGNITGGVDLFN